VVATASTDSVAPTSVITAPAAGASVPINTAVTISGTATDTGGAVGGVEVSVDGGATWRRASGRASWSYTWTPTANGTVTIRSRAADDSGNLEAPSAGRSVTVGADVTPPTVSARSPASGATGVSRTTKVTATFNEAMDAATINTNTVQLTAPGGALVPATMAYAAATRIATLTPSSTLAALTVYTATVRGGTTDPRVKDQAGNALAATQTWQFRTQ
jgi:Bacterial Ig-like domain/Bacterial Ig domain